MQKNLSNPYASHLTRWHTVYFPEDSDILAIKQALEQVPEIEFVEFRSKPKLRYRPNDPVFDDQWHLPYCGFDIAWDFTKGSKEVVIGIVDTGIDIELRNNHEFRVHEDLEANLWFNLGEDADGDGHYTPDDWNRQDDDENGYIDDFFGWDVTAGDNCPDDIWARMYSHGTLVAGTASGVSDNGIGIASGGFNCSLMIIACYDEEGAFYIGLNCYEGILYCAQMGADVINTSWGGYEEFSEHDNEIIQFANEQGSIVIGAAGNDNEEYNLGEEITDYPLGYEGVIGVGSITNQDVRTEWSNWGNLVDIVAPGEIIYTCEPGNEYTEFSGNSAATPIVAGLAGLLLSVMPDLSADQLLEIMQNTATDVSDLNEEFTGIQYRINAAQMMRSLNTMFQLDSCEFVEVTGDNDNRYESGEEFAVPIIVSNQHPDSLESNVIITIESEDPAIEFSFSEIEIGELDVGAVREVNFNDAFRFSISECIPHFSSFTIKVISERGMDEFEIPLIIGQPQFLIVDDDEAEALDSLYRSDLDQIQYLNETFCTVADDLPEVDFFTEYEVLIWSTGNMRNPLTEQEIELIKAYLDSGGFIILIGQYIGDDHADSDLLTDYIHVQHVEDEFQGSNNLIRGISNNPISDGLSLLLSGEGGAENNDSPSVCSVIDEAIPIFTFSDGESEAGTYFENRQYRAIYLGFALEAASGRVNTSTRSDFFRNALDYILDVKEFHSPLLPTASIINPAYPNPFNSTVNFTYQLSRPSAVRIEVYNALGQKVSTLLNSRQDTGIYESFWNAEDNPTGIYLIRFETKQQLFTNKVLLLR